MQLSIIIVNYKSPGLVIQCIDSLNSNKTGEVESEIIVVDNFSEDNSENLIRRKFPDIVFLQMGYNAGFARANNEGIKRSKGEVVLLLNSDTIVEKNAVELCFKKFLHSEYVACGVQLLNEDRSAQISGNFAMKGGLNYLLPLPYLGKFLKFISGFAKIKKPNVPEAKGIVEVDWINGAYLMVKKSVIEKKGLLDEDFFLYAEEAEWCSRLRKEGRLCIYGDFNVVHLQGETSNEAFGSTGKGYFNLFDKRGLQIMVSNFLRIRKEFGVMWLLIDLSFYFISVPVFFIGLIFSVFIPKNNRHYSFSQWKGFAKNILILLSYSPKMILQKKYFYKVL